MTGDARAVGCNYRNVKNVIRHILILTAVAGSACTSSALDTEPPDRAAIAMSLADTTLPLIPSAATEATPELQLGRLGAAIPMAGHVVVLDMMPPHVKVYDSTGVGVRSFLQVVRDPARCRCRWRSRSGMIPPWWSRM